MHNAIITSLLDTDLYKFTMMQCAFHQFPESQVEYRFKSRRPIKDLISCQKAIRQQIAHLCDLSLTEEELEFLQSLPYFKTDFIDFLRSFRLQEKHIQISGKNSFELTIKGPWVNTILFEVPVLSIISEVYYRQHYPHTDLQLGKEKLIQKMNYLQKNSPDLQFSDFGTRRRFSKEWQQEVLSTLGTHLSKQFVGTSNVYFANEFNVRPIGTMAHEFLQACQVLAPNIKGSQHFALTAWLKEYPDALGIALTDVLTMDVFLQEFDDSLARQYTGLRQDSGDPFVWGDKAIAHYESLKIDPRTKTFVFSDGLTIPLAVKIQSYFQGKCQPFFGIGTNLTNDVGFDPLDIVIKMTHTNQKPVVKISDSLGKIICEDDHHLQHVKQLFHIKD